MNSGTIKGLIGLVVGAIIGGVAAYKIQKERWEDKYYEEVEKIKDDYIYARGDFKEDVTDSNEEDIDSEEDAAICKRYIDEYKAAHPIPTENVPERDENDPYSSPTLVRFRAMKKERERQRMKTRPYVDHPYYISEDEYYQMCESIFDYQGYELYFEEETGDVYNVDGTLFEKRDDAWIRLGKGMLDIRLDEAPDPLYVQNDDLKEVYMLFKSRGSGMNEHRHSAGPPSNNVWHRYEFDDLDSEEE